MNSEEPGQDFEKLQRLLKLKRYEQPPPRYFNDLSTRVITHIRADTSVARFETADNLISRTPWLRRIWRKLESQPAVSGAIATVACGLMVAGVFFMEETGSQNVHSLMVAPGGASAAANAVNLLPNDNLTAASALPAVSSTNLLPGVNLFEQTGPLRPGQLIYGRSLLEK
ncbi:MAG TPA: hypothetical protein VFZ59_04790 [Verrucomicrobiae bacterium]|nr:hypothetical protein [Verrucomicrobiae bacterium]